MTSTATMSSMMANAVKNTRRSGDARLPRSVITPSEKAVSVPMGTPHPRVASPPELNAR
jgi:hypothetical protein